MALPAPKLDDRTFQDLVDEAKRRIPLYCPEWTDHNVSDPGVTLIELFAWMVDTLLYRVNQVPDLHYVKMMELIGLKLHEPTAAQVPTTFLLTAPRENDMIIPAGTEVATERRESEEPIIFATNDDFFVRVPTLEECRSGTENDAKRTKDRMADLKAKARSFEPFPNSPPKAGDAFYVGFGQDLSQHVIALAIDCSTASGAGVDPDNPPWTWEGWDGEEWQNAPLQFDETGGFNRPGSIRLFLPDLDQKRIGNKQAFWIRCRLIEPDEVRRAYLEPPSIRSLTPTSVGGTIQATHQVTVLNEVLGRSDGAPGQVFSLRHAPILRRREGETIFVQDDSDGWIEWQEVDDFADSTEDDLHFAVDGVSGEVRFGPTLRQPDGTMRSYGAVPTRGRLIRFSKYRYGGGVSGNVQAGKLRILKGSIPYVGRVWNRFPARDGSDAETIEAARMRAPSLMRVRDRAVTADDYVFLAMEAAKEADQEIARVHCIQPSGSEESPSPGTVYLLVVPRVRALGHDINPEMLALSEDLKAKLMAYLDERRLLTVRLSIREPEYVLVSVEAEVTGAPHLRPETVQRRVQEHLYAFLNPLTGGRDGKGWPFGRNLFISDVYACVQQVEGVAFVKQVRLYELVRGDGAKASPRPTDEVELPTNSLLCSYGHKVEVSVHELQ